MGYTIHHFNGAFVDHRSVRQKNTKAYLIHCRMASVRIGVYVRRRLHVEGFAGIDLRLVKAAAIDIHRCPVALDHVCNNGIRQRSFLITVDIEHFANGIACFTGGGMLAQVITVEVAGLLQTHRVSLTVIVVSSGNGTNVVLYGLKVILLMGYLRITVVPAHYTGKGVLTLIQTGDLREF